MVIIMEGDYMQLFVFDMKTRTTISQDGARRKVPISVLKELPWNSCEICDR